MSEKRRALGRGLGALIPSSPGTARPVDVFFRETAPPTVNPDHDVSAGQTGGDSPVGVDLRDRNGHKDGHDNGHDNGHENGNDNRSQLRTENGYPSGPDQRPEAAQGAHEDHGPLDSGSVDAAGGVELAPVPGATFAIIPITAIRPNPRQPRTVFDHDELAELANSIREIGVLQPVVVRPVPAVDQGDAPAESAVGVAADEAGPRFELIMGERRLRATQLAGLDTIPAIVKDTHDDDLLRDALLENLHRSQLNPLEEAAAYQQLLDDFGCSHDELATRIGRSRPQISNTIRLLRLPPLVARRVAAGVLSAGHARALLGLDDGAAMERLAQRIVAEGLSVRSVEEIVAMGGDDPAAIPRTRRPRAGTRHPQLDDLAARLSDRYDTRVTIALGQRKGRLTVEFASVDDLNRIIGLMERI
jgi:ParB family chromosome partitioning protein